MSDAARWSVDPRSALRVVAGEGVYAFRGETSALLRGAAYESVVALIDGTRSSDDLVDELRHAVPTAQVYFAIEGLRRQGWIVPTASPAALAERAWWLDLGADAGAGARMVGRRVGVVAMPGVDPALVESARDGLSAAGIESSAEASGAELLLVFAADVTDPALAEVNEASLRAGRPWLLVWPGSRRIWLGPVLRPGEGPCWECLLARRRAHRRTHSLAAGTDAEPILMPVVGTPLSAQVTGRIAALEIAKILGGLVASPPDGAPADAAVLIELDLADWHVERHTVMRRPQCRSCGDPTPVAPDPVAAMAAEAEPEAAVAASARGDGYRTGSVEDTFRRYRHHVSPITGVAAMLEEMPTTHRGLHVWFSGANLALPPKSLLQLRRSLRAGTAGKGTTMEQARVGALAEALERYSGAVQGDEVRIRGSLSGLGARAIHPNDCMLYSEAQLTAAGEINARGSWFNGVPERFDVEAELDWTPLWSLTRRREVLLPTGSLYFGDEGGHRGVVADSNGCAAGGTLTEAILQGTLELVERDAVALWWYNRVRRPAVDLEAMRDPWVDALVAGYRDRGREVWALDLTSDLGIPVVVALSRRVDHPTERILMAFGAHLDGPLATIRALTEMNQMAVSADEPGAIDAGFDRDLERWMRTATVADEPYLLPDPEAPSWNPVTAASLVGDDSAASLLACRERIEAAGLEMLVLDQTRADIGLPVARVVVPGLRPFWSRLAPGRLYDVPVQLGWLDAPLAETQLNPIAMFL